MTIILPPEDHWPLEMLKVIYSSLVSVPIIVIIMASTIYQCLLGTK